LEQSARYQKTRGRKAFGGIRRAELRAIPAESRGAPWREAKKRGISLHSRAVDVPNSTQLAGHVRFASASDGWRSERTQQRCAGSNNTAN